MTRISVVLLVLAACGTDVVAPDALPANCSNGVQDRGESDVDCGGSCGICALGERCTVDTDCLDGDAGYVATCRVEHADGIARCENGIPATYPSPVASNYCYVSGSTTWCQDYYSGKWCANTGWANGWDYVGCSWSGTNSYGLYCSRGWLWDTNGTHRHCN